jgi:hypothetical protein
MPDPCFSLMDTKQKLPTEPATGPRWIRALWPAFLAPYRETARMALEPWLVEAALARLGRTLSPADQRIVMKAARTPHKVKWPEWWSEHL